MASSSNPAMRAALIAATSLVGHAENFLPRRTGSGNRPALTSPHSFVRLPPIASQTFCSRMSERLRREALLHLDQTSVLLDRDSGRDRSPPAG